MSMKSFRFFLGSDEKNFVHQMQAIYVDKDTGNCYHDENKSAYEFDLSESICIREVHNGVLSRTFNKFFENFTGNFIINDEIIEKVREIVEKDDSGEIWQ